ncbi:MAG TPA: heparinase II/III family protein [Planctomycetota bacterium]|nr:heparinase II/III family protein [Planctomycetota bacterium]
MLVPLALVGAERGRTPPRGAKPLPDIAGALDRLVPGHPRLVLTTARIAAIKEQLRRDPEMRDAYDDVMRNADSAAARPVLSPTKDGTTTIAISRQCVALVYTCGIAWHLTGRDAYAEAVRANILAACAFRIWTDPRPDASFGMDTAEMLHAVAIAYDWLYERWTPDERAILRRAMIDFAFTPALRDFGVGGPPSWWVGSYINCTADHDAGLIIGALAIADEEPAMARTILDHALNDIVNPMRTYEPDGVWPEGPSYWHTTTFAVCDALSAMETALGSTLGIDAGTGLAGTGRYVVMTRSPGGIQANFGDSYDWIDLQGLPPLMWLARRYQRPEYAQAQIETLRVRRNRADARDLIWWPETPPVARPWPLDAYFAGRCDVASMRSGWDDDALFAWIKGGWNEVNHGHLDLGQFEVYALGKCWARDLGRDDYRLPGHHDDGQGGRRWTWFRMGTQSHNVPMIDGAQQNVAASAQIARWHEDPRSPFAIADLRAAYAPAATSAMRGLMLVERRAVLVQDEIVLARPAGVTWSMLTDASIAIDGGRAVLTLDGERLAAQILEPTTAVFSAASGERPPPELPNTGTSLLQVRIPAGGDRVRVTVLLAPAWRDGIQAPPRVRPLAEWGKPPKPERPEKPAKTKRGGRAAKGDAAQDPASPDQGSGQAPADAPGR